MVEEHGKHKITQLLIVALYVMLITYFPMDCKLNSVKQSTSLSIENCGHNLLIIALHTGQECETSDTDDFLMHNYLDILRCKENIANHSTYLWKCVALVSFNRDILMK